ncbi:MAG: DUF4169 family protein [Nitratireductor sp.]
MAEIINLRMARKRAARQAQSEKAEANRALHSIPSRERKAARKNDAKAATRLEGHLRDQSNPQAQD